MFLKDNKCGFGGSTYAGPEKQARQFSALLSVNFGLAAERDNKQGKRLGKIKRFFSPSALRFYLLLFRLQHVGSVLPRALPSIVL